MTEREQETASLSEAIRSIQIAQRNGESYGWQIALIIAEEAVDCFPPDTKQSLHRFGAETVLRAMRKEAAARGFALMTERAKRNTGGTP